MQKAAPTGQAALLIGGDTLHSLFRINVHGYSTKKEMPELSGEPLRDLQDKLKDVGLIIIDDGAYWCTIGDEWKMK